MALLSSDSISPDNACLVDMIKANPTFPASALERLGEIGKIVTLADLEAAVGRELGVVRISLGLASNFEDVHRVLAFARDIGREEIRRVWWAEWMEAKANGKGSH